MLPFDFARCRPYKPDIACDNCQRYSEHPDQTWGPWTSLTACESSKDSNCMYIAIKAKPVVHFVGEPSFIETEYKNGEYVYANVMALNHPSLGNGMVRTSIIVKKNKDGSFETLNSVYVPVKDLK